MADKVITHKPKPIYRQEGGLKIPKQRNWDKTYSWIGLGISILIILMIASSVVWYFFQLTPTGNDKGILKKIKISPGSTSSQIGKELESGGIIRSSFAFDIYVKLYGKNNVLKAGTYRLSPAESTPQIVQHFVNGSNDNFSITFFPGSTLSPNGSKVKQDVTSVLKKAGFSDSEIQAGLDKKYESPLFKGKPADSSLEGYVYGETYNFNIGATVEDILQRTFEEYYKQLVDNGLISGFSKHGLNLYQAITLASIVQREASGYEDQRKVAQVFYSRLDQGMTLGSDVTYQYIADKTGVPRDPNINSPYNTRRFKGLPPGPISNPGPSALKAVANPAPTDYLYFLAGDDKVIYFAHTDAEHQSNITDHCKINCAAL